MIVIVGVILGAVLIAVILWMLLTRRLREKYAVMWLVLGMVLLLLGVFPGLLGAATKLLGVELPANLLFAASLVVLLGVTLHLSWELSQNEEETRRLAEEIAILSARIDSIERDASAPATRSAEDVREDPAGPET